ncbi:MAG: CcdB family protein [Pseudomonadota bacterium]
MPSQFDIARLPSGQLAIVIQSDLLETTPTRVVIPLIQHRPGDTPTPRLNPVITVSGDQYILVTQQITTLRTETLTTIIASASEHRDPIIRAIDMLLSGI